MIVKKILVTGGAGFIGSHFCKHVARAGHEPIVFDNCSTGHTEFVSKFQLVRGDIQNLSLLTEVLGDLKPDGIVHFAAKSLVSESVLDPLSYYQNNVGGSLNILTAMSKTACRKIVLSSSCAIYGMAESDLMGEGHAKVPISPYGKSKLITENFFLDSQKSVSGLRVAILRYFNVIGQDPDGELFEKHEPETHIVPKIFQALLSGGEFNLFGSDFGTSDGSAIRDYVDVNDLAKIHTRALDFLNSKELLVSNVGSGIGHSNKEVLSACEKAWGKKAKIKIGPRRAGDPPRLVADPSYFKSWYPQKLKTLEESLENYKSNLSSESLCQTF